jgi:membrane associated rhomboid family serine protease
VIPFRDTNRSGTTPYVTMALIVVNVAVFIAEVQQPANQVGRLAEHYGLRPLLVTRLLRGDATLRPYAFLILRTFVTCMFLHAGLMHLLGNLLYLWIFGDNVEDRLGHVRFLLFYLLCGVGASVAHIAFNPNSPVPVVGASGAIAGVLGAYLLAFPRASVDTLVVLGIFITILRLPAFIVLGFWFVLQYLGGLQSMRMANMAGGVAWWAHVGGFVLGMLLLPIFQKPQEKRREYHYYR